MPDPAQNPSRFRPKIKVAPEHPDGAAAPKDRCTRRKLVHPQPGLSVSSTSPATSDEDPDEPLRLQRLLQRERAAERRRLARELHDELGQQLTVIQLALASLLEQPDAGAAQRIAALVDEAIASLRRLVTDWRPAALDGQGPTAALRALGRETSRRTGLDVRVRVSGAEAAVPHTVALALYRIVQESLTNVARHACARQVRVHLRWQPEAVAVTIEDDGIGLPEGALARGDTFGLRGLHERVAALGGGVTFDTPSRGGTRICVQLPLPAAGPLPAAVPA